MTWSEIREFTSSVNDLQEMNELVKTGEWVVIMVTPYSTGGFTEGLADGFLYVAGRVVNDE